jgi:hypothetical protein
MYKYKVIIFMRVLANLNCLILNKTFNKSLTLFESGVRVNESIRSFIYSSNAMLPKHNELLHVLSESVRSKTEMPIVVAMANRAFHLQYERHQMQQKLLLKLELSRKLKSLKKAIKICLMNPWHYGSACDYKKLTGYISLSCLIDDTNQALIDKHLRIKKNSGNNLNYTLFCWIIYAINFIEYCQLNILNTKSRIYATRCSIDSIQIMIQLTLTKIEETTKNNYFYLNTNIKSLFESFFEKFKNRSMQIIVTVLLFVNKKLMRTFDPQARSLYHYQLKVQLEAILNYLLNNVAVAFLKKHPKYRLLDKQKLFEVMNDFAKMKIDKIKTDLFIRSNTNIMQTISDIVY